jgi:ankyrin repeat protein
LLESGADIEAKENNSSGLPALHLAAEAGRSAIVDLMAASGADLEAKNTGWTALHYAVSDGHTAVLQVLLQRGADPKVKSSIGSIALCLARSRGKEEVLRLLSDEQSRAENDH